MTLQPRNDFVLFRIVNLGAIRKIAMPDQAVQGKERIVVAVGPKVEGLAVGDKVYVIGSMGQDVIPFPGERDLYLTKEANVALVEREGE